MANETRLRKVEYICGNCGFSDIVKINCGVNTDWHEQVKCKNCGETDLVQWNFIIDEPSPEDIAWLAP